MGYRYLSGVGLIISSFKRLPAPLIGIINILLNRTKPVPINGIIAVVDAIPIIRQLGRRLVYSHKYIVLIGIISKSLLRIIHFNKRCSSQLLHPWIKDRRIIIAKPEIIGRRIVISGTILTVGIISLPTHVLRLKLL